MSSSLYEHDAVSKPKHVVNTEAVVRVGIIDMLQNGERTLHQLHLGLGVGTRTLSKILAELVSDQVIYSEFIPGDFPRKIVYGLRKMADSHGYKPVKGRPTSNGAIEVHASLPPYLFEIIRREAMVDRRSFSAQLVWMLESTLSTEGQ